MYKNLYIVLLIVLCSINTVFAQEAAENKKENNEAPEKKVSEDSHFSHVKFKPNLALIVDMSAVYRSLSDEVLEKTRIRGFDHYDEEEHGHNHVAANANIGFNLNYAELALSATVDPYFELAGIFHASPMGFEIEETYFKTTSIPAGFGLKAGKFLSGFGKLNGQHCHEWDFTDQPLPYYGIFGCEGLNEPGLQLTWVAPADFFLAIGAEALQGANETSFGTKKFHDTLNLQRVGSSRGPNAYTAFVKSSFHVENLIVVLGVSGAMGVARRYHDFNDIGLDAMTVETLGCLGEGIRAKTWIAGAELVMKYSFDSNRFVSFQGESLYRVQQGRYFYTTLFPISGTDVIATAKVPYYARHWGAYGQIIVKPFLQWRFGARFDALGTEVFRVAGMRKKNEPVLLYRVSGMIDYHPSEFSLFRLQYNYDRSRVNRYNHSKPGHEVVLQANISIGTHEAHPHPL